LYPLPSETLHEQKPTRRWPRRTRRWLAENPDGLLADEVAFQLALANVKSSTALSGTIHDVVDNYE